MEKAPKWAGWGAALIIATLGSMEAHSAYKEGKKIIKTTAQGIVIDERSSITFEDIQRIVAQPDYKAPTSYSEFLKENNERIAYEVKLEYMTTTTKGSWLIPSQTKKIPLNEPLYKTFLSKDDIANVGEQIEFDWN